MMNIIVNEEILLLDVYIKMLFFFRRKYHKK